MADENYISEEDIEETGSAVIEMAREIFEKCGAENDFCVQAIGTAVVFGGYNRIKLSKYGWSLEAGFCTEKFRIKFKELFGRC